MTKIIICNDCGEEKEHIAFGLCKSCYEKTPKIKEYRKKYKQRSEVKSRRNMLRQRPEVKEKEKVYNKEYIQRPEVKVRQRKYRQEYEQKTKVKLYRKLYGKEYRQRPEIKLKMEEYDKTRKCSKDKRCIDCGNLIYDNSIRCKHCSPIYHFSKEKHWCWNGGSSFEPYGLDFNERFRELVRQRDNYCCVICNKTQEELGEKLSIHHIDYDKTNSFLQNVVSLCREHHTITNINRELWKLFFQKLLTERYKYEYTKDQQIILDLGGKK